MQTCDSQMSLDTLRKVSADDIPKLCEVLARAFANDSIARYVLPDDDSRERRLRRLYRVYFSVFLRHGSCYTDAGLKGAALWLPPGRYPLSLAQHMRVLPALAFAVAMDISRALRVLNHLDETCPRQGMFWYLGVLGVEPIRQRHGLGSNLIRPILSCCDDQGLGAYLETGTESNLPFYSKHGFTVMRESRIKNGPRLWHLWREPLFRNPAVAW
jgi:GNAT superfamily N-acetyltransferase